MSTITWICVGIYQSDTGTSCALCGHAIKQIAIVQSSNGERLEIGADCAASLTGQQEVIGKAEMRMKKAAAQWKKQDPALLPDETRDHYINRRHIEMGNAITAYNVYISIPRHVWEKEGREAVHQYISVKYKANQFDYSRPVWQVKKI